MQMLGLCDMLLDAATNRPLSDAAPAQLEKSAAARRLILRSREPISSVHVICRGWAATSEYLRNGRRQILPFALPGDLVCASLFADVSRYNVEAVTRVNYRSFDRAALCVATRTRPDLVDLITRLAASQMERIAELAVDLGRRSAAQRVARLILSLMERLEKSGMVRDQAFNFPLRQTHIADALGLTTPYVNQVLNTFRRKGLISFEKRSLTVLDAPRLRAMID